MNLSICSSRSIKTWAPKKKIGGKGKKKKVAKNRTQTCEKYVNFCCNSYVLLWDHACDFALAPLAFARAGAKKLDCCFPFFRY
jgi:hypothetical protein